MNEITCWCAANLGEEVPKLGNVDQEVLSELEQGAQGCEELALQNIGRENKLQQQVGVSPRQAGPLKASRQWDRR